MNDDSGYSYRWPPDKLPLAFRAAFLVFSSSPPTITTYCPLDKNTFQLVWFTHEKI
jgi:hypothetical protein